jgi:uncharacterized protein (DUF342 family)
MADEKNDSGQETTEANGIDQIREIIFGEQLIAWQQRFSELEKALSELHKTVESGFSRLEMQIGTEKQNLTGNVQELRTDVSKDTDNLRSQIAAARKQLAALDERKVDRDSIGEVFIQWGQKVKAKE